VIYPCYAVKLVMEDWVLSRFPGFWSSGVLSVELDAGD
jgi:hypothetical protein